MYIKNHDFSFLIKANLIFVLILYFDFFLPAIHNRTERLKSFYNAVNESPGWKSGSIKEVKYILECENENIYYIGKFPQGFENIQEGKKVEIEQSLFLKKVKSIKIENKIFDVSFLTINLIVYIFIFCVLFNILNIFFTNKFLDVMLSITTPPIYFIGLVYIFAY